MPDHGVKASGELFIRFFFCISFLAFFVQMIPTVGLEK
jgi:hypothetical protein